MSLSVHINATAPKTAAPRIPIPWAIKLFAKPVLEAAAVLAPLAEDEGPEAVADALAAELELDEPAPVPFPASGHVGAGRSVTPAVRQSCSEN